MVLWVAAWIEGGWRFNGNGDLNVVLYGNHLDFSGAAFTAIIIQKRRGGGKNHITEGVTVTCPLPPSRIWVSVNVTK